MKQVSDRNDNDLNGHIVNKADLKETNEVKDHCESVKDDEIDVVDPKQQDTAEIHCDNGLQGSESDEKDSRKYSRKHDDKKYSKKRKLMKEKVFVSYMHVLKEFLH